MAGVALLSAWDCDMQAQHLQNSLAEEKCKQLADRLASRTLEHAKAQQQLQKSQRTILGLIAQLQKADTAAADKLQVSCAYTCCQGLVTGAWVKEMSWRQLACSCSATTRILLAVSLFATPSDCRHL